MLASNALTIKGLIDSKNGTHLTGYLVNRDQDLAQVKNQLAEIRDKADEFLVPAMNSDERSQFLAPIDHLLRDARVLEQMKGNIGLFRKKDAFRLLSIPVDVERICIVATSFHVKPLLRWIQSDQAFLLLGLDGTSAHLYLGNQQSVTKVDSFVHGPATVAKQGQTTRMRERRILDSLSPVHDWLEDLTQKHRPKLFVAGEPALTKAFYKEARYRNLVRTPISDSCDDEVVSMAAATIRSQLKSEVSLKLKNALVEFEMHEEMRLSKKNIFQIAKLAVQGRIRKLIVADGIRIFGKLDPETGGLALNPYDLDHEDDDILDDLAQTVLAQGGEVLVARKEEIPNGRPLLAILNR